MLNQEKPSNNFLPRLAKQKVLEKFIDLSTADVFNHTAAAGIRGLTNRVGDPMMYQSGMPHNAGILYDNI